MHVDEVHAEAGGDRPRDAADVLLALLEDDVVKLLCQLPALREAGGAVSERRLKRGAARVARASHIQLRAGDGLERRQRRRRQR